jgi:hypothetical protein
MRAETFTLRAIIVNFWILPGGSRTRHCCFEIRRSSWKQGDDSEEIDGVPGTSTIRSAVRSDNANACRGVDDIGRASESTSSGCGSSCSVFASKRRRRSLRSKYSPRNKRRRRTTAAMMPTTRVTVRLRPENSGPSRLFEWGCSDIVGVAMMSNDGAVRW